MNNSRDLQAENTILKNELFIANEDRKRLEEKVYLLTEELKNYINKKFAQSSEKLKVKEEVFQEELPPEDKIFNEIEKESLPQKERKSSQRVVNKENVNVPTKIIDHFVADDTKCPACDATMSDMGFESVVKLEIIPSTVSFIEHRYHKCACRNCQNNSETTPIIQAEKPVSLIPGSFITSSAIAYFMFEKFFNAMPIYRISKMFENSGIELSRQTISNQLITCSELYFEQAYDLLKLKLNKEPIIHADETSLKIINSEAKSNYEWVYTTGKYSQNKIVLYEAGTRSSKHPIEFLSGFSGYLHVDAYSAYEKLKNVNLIGCMAHARRKFIEAINVSGSELPKAKSIASDGLKFITDLYAIEAQLKDSEPDEIFKIRQESSREILDNFEKWLHKYQGIVLPKSAIGKAVDYCLNQWSKLTAFLADGRLEIDNNRAERAVKPFVIGRKNWLFSNTKNGAKCSSILYSIVRTAEANNLNIIAYLTYFLDKIPLIYITDTQALEDILPTSNTLPDFCRL